MAAIKVNPWGEGQGDFVMIDEENFNPDFHALYDPECVPGPAPVPETVDETETVAPEKPKRGRRTKAQIEADAAAETGE